MTPAQMKQYGKGLGLWQDKELATGEPIQYLKKDDLGFVQLIKKAEGMWLGTDDECKKPVNPIENGVFVWTEIKGAGHAFVSVHESNSPFVYTYGRFGRVGNPRGAVGDGVLNFFKYEDAREYYRDELYSKSARVFMITDADPAIARKYFERLWSNGVPAVPTPDMGTMTKRNGHTIDRYDVTGKNCTTHTADGVKMAGSSVFKGGYTTKSQMRVDSEEDFAVPVSLHRYLIKKSSETSMQVVEVTAEFRKQYPNTTKVSPAHDDSFLSTLAEVASAIGKLSPYSGGSVGGVLSGVSDAVK